MRPSGSGRTDAVLDRSTLQLERDGLRIELAPELDVQGRLPVGQPFPLRLRITDADGTPVRGLRPRMWVGRNPDGPAGSAPSCEQATRRYVSGRLDQRADRDLNGFLLATLNGDATVSVINPLIQMGSTRLESLITLPAKGEDWVHAPAGERLYVTLPDRRALAVVDLRTLRLLATVDLGDRGVPRRLALSRDERRVWVALDDSDRLVAVDTRTLEPAVELRVGGGRHAMATTEDGTLLVTGSDAGTVDVVDMEAGTTRARIAVGGAPSGIAWSPLARKAYVIGARERAVSVLDPRRGEVERTLDGLPPLTALRTDPSGRFVLGVSQSESQAVAIDSASSRVIGPSKTVDRPDQVVFTQRFAYVRGIDSLSVTLFELQSIERGEMAATTIPVYQRLPSAAPEQLGSADLIAPVPDGDGAVVANGADTSLYLYTEGMMAPQGTYRTYGRAPRALRVIDRSIRETAPGEYMAQVTLDRAGRYTIPLLLERPRLVHCFDLQAGEVTETVDATLKLDWQVAPAQGDTLRANQDAQVTVRVLDAAGRPVPGLRDVLLTAVELPGLSQQRGAAQEIEPGVYRWTGRFHSAGKWRLIPNIASRGLALERAPTHDFSVWPADAPSNATSPPSPPASPGRS